MKFKIYGNIDILIDEEDLSRIQSALKKGCYWKYNQHEKQVIGWLSNETSIRLSRFLMGVTDPKLFVDHKHHNPFDYRKSELRVCTCSQNTCNQRKQSVKTTSPYKGVSWHKRMRKWRSYIQINKKSMYLGYFKTQEEAARVYNAAAIKYHGEFACINKL